ncbi:MAG: GntR family transcriptional regulator [Gemmobacter sp.]
MRGNDESAGGQVGAGETATEDEPASPHSAMVRERLGDLILKGQLRPGEFLTEGRIAERFGVSRTPVREAIRELAAAGLVTLRPRQRAVVAGLSLKDTLDRFEMMAELEAACASLAARRHTPPMLARIQAAHAECEVAADTQDFDAYYAANEHFHEAIYRAGGNLYLMQETRRLRNRMRVLRMAQAAMPGRMGASFAEHCTVLAAIASREAQAAADAMRAHLIVQGEMLRILLESADPAGPVDLADRVPGGIA